MTSQEIAAQLERSANAVDFVARSYELVDAWQAAGYGVETIEPILRFMEEHPEIDFGAPGPLVHFMETFYKKGYEQRLIDSTKKSPLVTRCGCSIV